MKQTLFALMFFVALTAQTSFAASSRLKITGFWIDDQGAHITHNYCALKKEDVLMEISSPGFIFGQPQAEYDVSVRFVFRHDQMRSVCNSNIQVDFGTDESGGLTIGRKVRLENLFFH